MNNIATVSTNLPATTWEQAASNSGGYLQGELLRFRDGRYFKKDDSAVPDGMQLVATDLKVVWTRWQDGKPIDQREEFPGRPIYRDEFGYDDQSK
jgi:hypothetical protein